MFRVLQKIPDNLCIRRGHVPTALTSSTIVRIPELGTSKSRPISLTSCFSKVRIILTRLMHRLQGLLSPNLYGFLPQRSTHHCLMDLYPRLSSDSVTAFIDLKSVFDVANRDVILDQLVKFVIKRNLLCLVKGYLSNRNSQIHFRGACSPYDEFELCNPQCGVLSPFLFHVLMHRLLSLLPESPRSRSHAMWMTNVFMLTPRTFFNYTFRT